LSFFCRTKLGINWFLTKLMPAIYALFDLTATPTF
jgi:hypothetical protein